MAFLIPAAFVLLCFVKKLTVIGIIGNTHGVNKAANPPKKLKKNNVNKLVSFSLLITSVVFEIGVTVTPFFSLKTRSTSVGAEH